MGPSRAVSSESEREEEAQPAFSSDEAEQQAAQQEEQQEEQPAAPRRGQRRSKLQRRSALPHKLLKRRTLASPSKASKRSPARPGLSRLEIAQIAQAVGAQFRAQQQPPRQSEEAAVAATLKRITQKPLTAFKGKGPLGSTEADWAKFRQYFEHRMATLAVPLAYWPQVLESILEDPASTYYYSNLDKVDGWESACAVLAAAPFSRSVTDYGVRAQLYSRTLAATSPSQVLTKLTQWEELMSQAPTPMSAVDKVSMVLWHLPEDLRQTVLVTPTSQAWQVYEDFRQFLVSHVNAAQQAMARPGSSRPQQQQSQQPQRGRQERQARPEQRSSERERSQPRERSEPPKKKQRQPGGRGPPKCAGCGTADHLVADMGQDGKPVCPSYDPSKAGKGKRKAPFGRRN